ncbi:MAG: hypothetical protein AAB320_09055 [Elusimicrobiota bacterium]
MKKLLGTTLALALILPLGQVNASEFFKNMKFSGQLDLQGTSANNVTDFQTRHSHQGNTVGVAGSTSGRDRMSDMQTRVMISMDWDLLDDVHSRVTLTKRNRAWGDPASNTAGETLTVVQGAITADEANVKIDKVFGAIDTTLGRQFYGTAGDLMVYYGPNDKALYGMTVTALDSARFDWSGESAYLTALFGNTNAHALGAVGATGRQEVRGLVLGTKGMENVAASAYVWNMLTHNQALGVGVAPTSAGNPGDKNDNLYVFGVKVKVKAENAWLAGEIAKNYGSQRNANGTTQVAPARNYIGWGFLLDAGIKADIEGLGALTPWGQFAYGTGDQNTRESQNRGFQTINSDYRPGAIYGRFSDVIGGSAFGNGIGLAAGTLNQRGLNNRIIWGGGLKVTPAAVNKLTVGASYWDFKLQSRVFGPNTNPIALGNKNIGSEADLDFSWAHSENVTLALGGGMFFPGGLIKEQIQTNNINGTNPNSQKGNSPAQLAYFDVRVKWGGAQ